MTRILIDLHRLYEGLPGDERPHWLGEILKGSVPPELAPGEAAADANAPVGRSGRAAEVPPQRPRKHSEWNLNNANLTRDEAGHIMLSATKVGKSGDDFR